jgi:hypothetical protein
MLDDHTRAAARRRWCFHDLIEPSVDRSPGLLKRLVIVGLVLSLEAAGVEFTNGEYPRGQAEEEGHGRQE